MLFTPRGLVLTFKIKRFPPPVVGNGGDSDTKGENEGRLSQKKVSNVRIPWVCRQWGGVPGNSHLQLEI